VSWNREETLTRQVAKSVGLVVYESVIYFSTETFETKRDGSGLWWKDLVPNFKILDEAELKAAQSTQTGELAAKELIFGFKFDSIIINVPVYLQFLMSKVENLGAKLVRHQIPTDGGVAGVIQKLSALHTSPEKDPHGIVLATGLSSAKFLPKDEAEKLYPIRGQTVLVSGEISKAKTHIFSSADELLYMMPRYGSGTTLIGGCKQAGNWEEKEDPELTKRILSRAKGLVPELLKDGEFEVKRVQVGRRPGRMGGPRVELEQGKIGDFEGKLVHAYGHSGAGFQNSIGTASKIVKLLEGQ
jgi:D-amino-acid oxidase